MVFSNVPVVPIPIPIDAAEATNDVIPGACSIEVEKDSRSRREDGGEDPSARDPAPAAVATVSDSPRPAHEDACTDVDTRHDLDRATPESIDEELAYPSPDSAASPTPEESAPLSGPVQPKAGHGHSRGRGRGKRARDVQHRTYPCEHEGCSKHFTRPEHARRHMLSVHSLERPHQCDFPGCSKAYSRRDHLALHQKSHLRTRAPTARKRRRKDSSADSLSD
ncbi:hypothetical protein DENSPDRAFT_776658 [Dentipellis sp. KUC8613]|nr:hypothetical protein DENSPDRAFT_776658 [Dentipellis sp. KUC8613]